MADWGERWGSNGLTEVNDGDKKADRNERWG